MEPITLFMFPYAGASASVYEKWKPMFSGEIEVVPVELPGRGRRFTEPLHTRISSLVYDAYSRLSPRLAAGRYALFGHSLGSVIALELARHAVRSGCPAPVHLFVSGRAAPQNPSSQEPVYSLPDDAFLAKIASLGGTPRSFFEDEQLVSVFLPILKADYEASDTYRINQDNVLLPCGISVLHGMDDGPCEPADWGVHVEGGCSFRLFEGGHFFIHEQGPSIVEWMQRMLQAEAIRQ